MQGSNTARLSRFEAPVQSPFSEFNSFVNAAEVSGVLILACYRGKYWLKIWAVL
jgi:hypothetical protein